MQTLEGLILKLSVLGESDHRVWVLAEHGELMELKSKNTGVRGSKRRAHLEPLSLIRLNLHHSQKNHYLKEVQSVSGFLGMKNNWDSLIRAQLFTEILFDCLQTGLSDRCFYELTHDTFQMLEKNPQGLGLEWGLTHLAESLGHLPDFKECTNCHQSLSEAICPHCEKDSHPDVPFLYRKAIEFLRNQSGESAERLQLKPAERVALNAVLLSGFSAYWSRTPKSLAWISEPSAKAANHA